MANVATHSVLTVPLAYLPASDGVEEIVRLAREGAGYCCIPNAHMCTLAYDDPDFRRIVREAALCLPDSTVLQRARALLYGAPAPPTLKGADLMVELCRRAADLGMTVGFYGGGSEDALRRLQERLRARIPDLSVAFAVSPPFRALTTDELSRVRVKLRDAAPAILFVGLGCPKQERWMHDNVDHARSFMVGVGAAFDFNSGAVKPSPAWVHRAGLEWAYRLISEPRRLWRRYLSSSLRFLWLIGTGRGRS